MYNPLRYIDPSGWAMKPGNSRPDNPPGLGNYHPGIYNPTDSESVLLVRLPDVDVIATSLGSNANTNTTITPYTEGTPWNNYQQYSYLGTDTRPMPTLGSGGGGGPRRGSQAQHGGAFDRDPGCAQKAVIRHKTRLMQALCAAAAPHRFAFVFRVSAVRPFSHLPEPFSVPGDVFFIIFISLLFYLQTIWFFVILI